ncbi:alpha-xylosidase [Metabacillus litoralis]|uniref:alpha-D-xyloside xylohydrolase n=1 Tax=Metabacillus litoralis TaxID=152268 RepID=A0A5C6W044_9BACI|nr:alpha-xylosidase [Metabacillus litoralis]TXC90678.1 alpha-xylosidase [Metabacillus litoralis]
MKFTDGYWLIREGFELISGVQFFKATSTENTLKVLVAPKDISNRGYQLDTPLLTVEFSSPMKDIIRVKIIHHKGTKKRGPEFQLYDHQQAPVSIEETEETITFISGKTSAVINKKGPWGVQYLYDGKKITGSGQKSMSHITETATKTTYVREELNLGVGENIYGLGERFTSFVKNGQEIEIWNQDGGTASQQSYKNIPFYVSNKGYGVFINQPENVSLEVASEKVSKVQFSVKGESLDYMIFGGETLKEVISNYTTLTGKPAMPPAWSFGLWLSTSFTTNYDEETVNSFVEGMRERDIPLSVFHYDCFWMEALNWTDFEWDRNMFPDPDGMLKRMKEKGLKICVWINPYIAQESKLFDEAVQNGYLIKRPNGDVWQWDKWQPGMGIVDFTNPSACEWYANHLRRLVDMGVDSFKTDFGERIPTDVVYFDGSDPDKMHNYYTFLYNKVVFEVLKDQLGEGEVTLFARSATAGGQQFPVHWGGDCDATYESMAESIRGGLSLGLTGFGFWSHDIGGFESTAPADLFKRWVAFGLLSSHSRLHGSKSYRVPWAYDEEAVEVTRFFTKLKSKLMPYIFNSANDSAKLGLPMMRAMLLEFQDDPAVETLERQYMFGDSLLVAPILNEEGDVSFYLPKGKWTHLFTNEVIDGGVWRNENHGYLSLPLYARPNSIIAVGSNEYEADYDFANDVVLHLFQLEEGKTAISTVRNSKSEVELAVSVTMTNSVLTVKIIKTVGKSWSLLLRGILEINKSTNANIESTELGIKLLPEKDAESFTVVL